MVIAVCQTLIHLIINMSSFPGNSVLAKSYLDLANASNDKSIDDIEKTIITEANLASIHQQKKKSCMQLI